MPNEIFKNYIKVMFAGALCSCQGCESCHEYFHETSCPENSTSTYFDAQLYRKFCKRAYEKLMKMLSEEDDMPFPKDWDEDDIVNLIMEMK